ncbi:MAG: hypothetical protein HC890_17945 [Chloroflexaceae bacterium]|nr:hypothetical protein [Chloroflexaceae bacterium]
MFLVAVVAIGVGFRFYHLENKVYWIDEVHASLRASGYRKREFADLVPRDKIISLAQLQEFQRISPQKGWDDTVAALAENAEHAPGFYLLLRGWMAAFGSSVMTTRALAATLSLLAFPALYWLAWELFQCSQVAQLAIALLAVSPLQVLYAQEARQYSLWVVTVLVSSAALLKAVRRQTWQGWVLYSITIVFGFYTHLISGLVFFGHGLYLGVLEKWRWTQRMRGYVFASLGGLGSLIPWLWVYFRYQNTIGEWQAQAIPLDALVKRWLLNLNAVFF